VNDSSGNNNIMCQMPPGFATNQQECAENNSVESNAFPVQAEPIYATATVVDDPEPSAPPAAGACHNTNTSLDDEAKAAASGVKFGGKLGNVFKVNDETKVKLENTGAKASVAANKGIKAFKKMAGLSSK